MREKPPHPKKVALIEKKYEGENMQNPHLPELKGFLDENWEQIDEIFYSLQNRAGVMKPIHIPHRIKTSPFLGHGAAAAMSPNDRGSVIFKSKDTLSNSDHNLPQLIHFWIHEAVHAASNTKEKISIFPRISHSLNSGVASNNFTLNPSPEDKRMLKFLGVDLNEAITEHLGNTILSELSRRGIFKQSDESIKEEAAYQSQGESFAEIVAILAENLEVSEELVWQAFVHQYFAGEMPLNEFYATLLELSEGDTKSIREKMEILIDGVKASEDSQTEKEIETSNDTVKMQDREALEWSKRGLRLDQ